jgi:hypothetical protein
MADGGPVDGSQRRLDRQVLRDAVLIGEHLPHRRAAEDAAETTESMIVARLIVQHPFRRAQWTGRVCAKPWLVAASAALAVRAGPAGPWPALNVCALPARGREAPCAGRLVRVGQELAARRSVPAGGVLIQGCARAGRAAWVACREQARASLAGRARRRPGRGYKPEGFQISSFAVSRCGLARACEQPVSQLADHSAWLRRASVPRPVGPSRSSRSGPVLPRAGIGGDGGQDSWSLPFIMATQVWGASLPSMRS